VSLNASWKGAETGAVSEDEDLTFLSEKSPEGGYQAKA